MQENWQAHGNASEQGVLLEQQDKKESDKVYGVKLQEL